MVGTRSGKNDDPGNTINEQMSWLLQRLHMGHMDLMEQWNDFHKCPNKKKAKKLVSFVNSFARIVLPLTKQVIELALCIGISRDEIDQCCNQWYNGTPDTNPIDVRAALKFFRSESFTAVPYQLQKFADKAEANYDYLLEFGIQSWFIDYLTLLSIREKGLPDSSEKSTLFLDGILRKQQSLVLLNSVASCSCLLADAEKLRRVALKKKPENNLRKEGIGHHGDDPNSVVLKEEPEENPRKGEDSSPKKPRRKPGRVTGQTDTLLSYGMFVTVGYDENGVKVEKLVSKQGGGLVRVLCCPFCDTDDKEKLFATRVPKKYEEYFEYTPYDFSPYVNWSIQWEPRMSKTEIRKQRFMRRMRDHIKTFHNKSVHVLNSNDIFLNIMGYVRHRSEKCG